MFKVMMSDLVTYKQKADMTKELATYFSPFSPIQQFSQEVLFKQPQSKDKIIDVNLGMKNKDAELIKKLEKEKSSLTEGNLLALSHVKTSIENLNSQKLLKTLCN